MQCAFLKLPELSVLDTAMRIQERERERETVVLDMFAMFDVKSINLWIVIRERIPYLVDELLNWRCRIKASILPWPFWQSS